MKYKHEITTRECSTHISIMFNPGRKSTIFSKKGWFYNLDMNLSVLAVFNSVRMSTWIIRLRYYQQIYTARSIKLS